MANINRVVLVGNLTQGPGAAPDAERHIRLQASDRGQHAPQGRDRAVGGQAELLRRHRLGEPSGELLAVPVEGPPCGHRRAARVARVGCHDGSGKRQAVEMIAESVQFLGSRADERRRLAAVRPGGRGRRERRLPRLGRRRRHPLLRSAMAPKQQREQTSTRRRQPPGGATAPRRRNCHFCRDKVEEVDYKNITQLRRVHLGEGQDPLAPDHRRVPPAPGPGRGRGQARARDGAAPLRLGLIDASHPAEGRREGRPARRGRRRRARLRA